MIATRRLFFALCVLAVPSAGIADQHVQAAGLRLTVDATGGASQLASSVEGRERAWLSGPVRLTVRNEVTGVTASPGAASVSSDAGAIAVRRELTPLSLKLEERWTPTARGLAWDLACVGAGERAGHEVVIDFPALSADSRVFTPSELGVVSVAAHPDFTAAPYASVAWSSGRYYVLPLVSVFDAKTDSALTIALPPDANIPHLQVEWSGAQTLRLRLSHRGMGGGRPSRLRLLFYTHPADYRSVLRAYSDDFPRYFRPGLARGPYEGAFWYHHIQDHPEFDEMARQDVRFLWASFWFTYLGEYLPAESEWYPYTYARMWRLGQTMTDAKINRFVAEMHRHGIGTFAYLNVTEFGGCGGKTGDSAAADKLLAGELAAALVKDPAGHPIPTWEGAMAVNPRADGPLFPYLQEQLRRHLTRLPDLDGFCIDRLDWASTYDYARGDGLTMVGKQDAQNLAEPVAKAVQEVCRQAHAAGKRVYVNQMYRLEVLKDVDGVCHECDYPRGLGYLSPFRPASAWHQQKPYADDLLAFEAQLKTRLQFALFPQMIAHEFPISQQAANARAADMLELYAPLFARLHGKQQVLLPHCVSVSGPNEANLFLDGAGRYVAPVTSRVRFLARGGGPPEPVTLTLRVPDAAKLRWAHVYSADDDPSRGAGVSPAAFPALLAHTREGVEVKVPHHVTASVVVVGQGAESTLDAPAASVAAARARLVARPPAPTPVASRPTLPPGTRFRLKLTGVQVAAGPVSVFASGSKLGECAGGINAFAIAGPPPDDPVEVRVVTPDEGAWFVVECAQLLAALPDGRVLRVAGWSPDTGEAAGDPGDLRLRLRWCPPREVPVTTARFERRDSALGGNWTGKVGALAAWISGVAATESQNGYRLRPSRSQECIWADQTSDPRVLVAPGAEPAGARRSTCWFADPSVALSVTPPDAKPYRLTVYLLDYDRNRRAMRVGLSGEMGALDAQDAAIEETDRGLYLTWIVTSPVTVTATKTAGYNAVVSGVFIDPTN